MCPLRDKNLAVALFVERSSSLEARFLARIPDSLSDGASVSCARPMEIAAPQASITRLASAGSRRLSNLKFYAVRHGSKLGIYHSWSDCKGYVLNYPGARYKSFGSMTEAEKFMLGSD